ncbi:MAG: FtsX-like permease family protein [Butyrivibrio hungatei]|nr:FtsX-like permease family protein [Butyrivibrio hungatei]
MIKLTLKSIWEQKGINSLSVVLLSLVFSVQLLLCAWLEGILNLYNEDIEKANSLRLIFTLLILVSVTSIITLINYVMNKRRNEFRTLRLCGATPTYILACKLLHLLVIVIVSLLGGSILFLLLSKILNQHYKFNGLFPVYILFVVITAAELTVYHFMHRKDEKWAG